MNTIVHNFSAGPAALPAAVLKRAQDELLDWQGSGCSVMEISHRSTAFIEMARRTEAKFRQQLEIPENYRVLFLQGGATLQFSMAPMNLLDGKSADYLINGSWGQKAFAEAATVGAVRSVTADPQPGLVPSFAEWQLDDQAAYLHVTPNETIDGVELFDLPESLPAPLVADMSSNLLSRPIDVTQYGVIYAGAQKNLGPSGITVVIIRDELLDRCPGSLPKTLSYAVQASKGSMLNTPPTFAWYLVELVLDWIAEQGGATEIERRNIAKSDRLYAAVDQSELYRNTVPAPYRSRMNVVFQLSEQSLRDAFLAGAEAACLIGLKGHRSVGGLRASLYNAVDYQSVEALVAFMQEFERTHG